MVDTLRDCLFLPHLNVMFILILHNHMLIHEVSFPYSHVSCIYYIHSDCNCTCVHVKVIIVTLAKIVVRAVREMLFSSVFSSLFDTLRTVPLSFRLASQVNTHKMEPLYWTL